MRKRAYRVLIITLLLTISLLAVCPLSYARVYNGSTTFSYAATAVKGVEGETVVNPSLLNFSSNADDVLFFDTTLSESANVLAIRLQLHEIWNTQNINWFQILPYIYAGNSNVYSYTFYIVERSYDGAITDSISKSDYVYCATYSWDNKDGYPMLINQSYGDKFAGTQYFAPSTGGVSSLPDSEIDVIINCYSGLQTYWRVAFNPLIIGNGSGSPPSYGGSSTVKPGYNAEELPIPDDWQSELENDRDIYAETDIKLGNILNFVQNPATMLNTAMNKTSASFDWPELQSCLYTLNGIFGIPLVNTMAWAICLFGSVFSLFNLGISFAHTASHRPSHRPSNQSKGRSG